MNDQNLKPFNTWRESTHKIVSRIGGRCSAIARREKADYRQFLKLLIKYSSPKEAAYYQDILDNLIMRKGKLCDRRDKRRQYSP